MLIPQIIIVEEVLPEVRRRTARALYRDGLSQGEIGRLLGISQAMVSRYLKDKGRTPSSLEEIISSISNDMEVAARAGCGGEELVEHFCGSLQRSMSSGGLVKRYEERFGKKAPACCYGSPMVGPSRSQVLEDLEIAVSYLVEADISDLVPAVKVNMAYAQEGAVSTDEVAAFPGRVPDRAGRILRPLPAEFGVSRHLAGNLIEVMEKDRGIRCAMNLALPDGLIDTLKDMEGCLPLNASSAGGNLVRYLVDPGDFGIEPCLYIYGSSPLVLARFSVRVQERYSRRKEQHER